MGKEMIAMLLAGGQGSRLYALTQKLAKPAVPFGGKYRIIDFPLSNCVNSGIDTVGILTQYQPLVLNEYIGNGQPWDLDRLYGGVHVLPPYQQASGSDWYKGTANAIYQNINFIAGNTRRYLLISTLRSAQKPLDTKSCCFSNKFSGSSGCTQIVTAKHTAIGNAKLHHKFFFGIVRN